MDYVLNSIGVLLILFVAYWFWWRKKSSAVAADSSIVEIKVTGGVYQPAEIKVQQGEEVTLRFIREDQTPCAATVVFADFAKSAELALNQPTEVVLTPIEAGNFEFTCQMGMYRGRLVVLEA